MADPVPNLDDLVELGARAFALESGDTDEYWSLYAADARAILTAVLPRVVGPAVEALEPFNIRARGVSDDDHDALVHCTYFRSDDLRRARTTTDQLRALGGG